jgi:hypothetical protein
VVDVAQVRLREQRPQDEEERVPPEVGETAILLEQAPHGEHLGPSSHVSRQEFAPLSVVERGQVPDLDASTQGDVVGLLPGRQDDRGCRMTLQVEVQRVHHGALRRLGFVEPIDQQEDATTF